MNLLTAYLTRPATQRIMRKKPGQEGFSLIELVVVIAVLAILAVIALPNFQGVTQSASAQSMKTALADIYKANFMIYATMPGRKFAEGDMRIDQMPKVRDSAMYLAEEMYRAPLMMIPCIEGRLENIEVGMGAGGWGSLLPAVWSFMLALRSRGLGSAWTTIHLILEGEKKAAEILGIPHDKITQGGLFPIAYTIGTDFKPAKRLPLEKVLHWDKW